MITCNRGGGRRTRKTRKGRGTNLSENIKLRLIWKCQAGGARVGRQASSVSGCIGGESSGGEPGFKGEDPSQICTRRVFCMTAREVRHSTPLTRMHAWENIRFTAQTSLKSTLLSAKSKRLVSPTRVLVPQSKAIVSLHLYGGGLTPELSQVRVHGNQRRRGD